MNKFFVFNLFVYLQDFNVMTPLVLHLREFAKTSRIKKGSSFSIVNVRMAIKEEIAIISMNAKEFIILVKMMESVKIYQELSNALVKMIMKGTHVKIHAIPSQIIVNMVENAKIKLVYMLVTAKRRDMKGSIVRKMPMNVKLWVGAKTMANVQMKLVVLPVIAQKILALKGQNFATNLNTVSVVFSDLDF